MSDEIEIVIDSNETIVESELIIDVVNNNNIVDIESSEPDVVVTFKKQEYVIVGDDMYIPLSYDEAPQWLKDTITNITDFSLNQKLTEIGALSNTLYGLIDELNVAKNTYTMSIINSAEIDERINARIETLNSSLSGSDATIVDLIATKATPTEASALALNVLTASINDGAISSLVSNLQNAISTTNSTLSNNIDIVHSEMTGEFEANAEVVNAIETSVTNINGTLTSHAGQITNLQASASAVDGKIATANSSVINTVNATIANGDAVVESKWAYNSSLNIGGTTYNSGFGLSNSAGTGVGSEFWIDASRFKFTNSAKTGSKAPFTIQTDGAIPEITFNGKVSFTNVTNTSGTGSNLLYNSAPKIGSETKGWYVWTNSGMTVNLSAGWDVWKPTGGASVAANIAGSPTIGSVFDVGQSSNFPVIAGSRYEASAYISAHRTNSYVFVVFYDAAGNYIVEAQGNVINYAGSSALVNWGRSSVFTTAPSNAATAKCIIRSIVTGNAPYCFVTNAFAGVAEANQTTPSNWSEGTSAGATYTSELSNDAGFVLPGGIATNNDLFAQKLGYTNYAAMVSAASNGQSIITGGYVNTLLIQANSINANQINTTGLIAENISADEINGKTFNGGVFNGARINGAVIKASYLDLDGDLEVLTNYHITVAMRNANPSLYTDAVYISADNEYRIPSISTIRESTTSQNITTVSTIYGAMWSYNTANAGNNLKAVKIRPIWNNQVAFELFRSVSSDTFSGYSFSYGIKNKFRLSLGSTLLIECTLSLSSGSNPGSGNDDVTIVTISGSQFATITSSHNSFNFTNYHHSYNIDIGIGILIISVDFSSGSYAGGSSDGDNGSVAPNRITIVGTLNTGSKLLPFDWTSGRLKFEQVVAPSPYFVGSKSEYTVFSLNQSIYINNMI